MHLPTAARDLSGSPSPSAFQEGSAPSQLSPDGLQSVLCTASCAMSCPCPRAYAQGGNIGCVSLKGSLTETDAKQSSAKLFVLRARARVYVCARVINLGSCFAERAGEAVLRPAWWRRSSWRGRAEFAQPSCFSLLTVRGGCGGRSFSVPYAPWTFPAPREQCAFPGSLCRDPPRHALPIQVLAAHSLWSAVFSADVAGVSLQAPLVAGHLFSLSVTGWSSGGIWLV